MLNINKTKGNNHVLDVIFPASLEDNNVSGDRDVEIGRGAKTDRQNYW